MWNSSPYDTKRETVSTCGRSGPEYRFTGKSVGCAVGRSSLTDFGSTGLLACGAGIRRCRICTRSWERSRRHFANQSATGRRIESLAVISGVRAARLIRERTPLYRFPHGRAQPAIRPCPAHVRFRFGQRQAQNLSSRICCRYRRAVCLQYA